MPFRHRIGRWVASLDGAHSHAMRRWYRLSSPNRPWVIVPYMGFGTTRRLAISGRVLRERTHRPPMPDDSSWRNFAEFWKRLESDELPGARVRASFRDHTIEAVADHEGHFTMALDVDDPVEAGWHAIGLELIDPAPPNGLAVRTQADVLVPHATARFGVISDIDDTIVWSDVGRKLRMLAMLMRSNARVRKPFKGVGAFYRALHRGARGDERNPLFYVSSSPWNLYTPLLDFLRMQGLPRGPLMLRDFGEHLLFGTSGHHAHKRRCIDQVLAACPDLPFVLIGDSGEQDPEIYAGVVADHGSRVRTIYIRSVTADPSRVEAIDRLAAQVQGTGTQLVLIADSEAAAVHAAGEGLIDANALAEVREDRKDDALAADAVVGGR